MSAVATRSRSRGRELKYEPRPESSARRLFEPSGQTLEDSILGVWEDLVAEGRAGCPVCGGSLRVTGGCAGCGSELT